jgi:hypothetical protein
VESELVDFAKHLDGEPYVPSDDDGACMVCGQPRRSHLDEGGEA